MKACRFILNTDYITSQNDQEIEISVAMPSSFTVSANQVKHFKTTKTVPGSSSRNYRCYIVSTSHTYAAVGCVVCTMKYGSDQLMVAVTHNKDSFTLDIFNDPLGSSHTFSGAGRIVTAHIQTFVDPFQV